MDESKQQLCRITIMFPVESDEQAIEYKKKIAEVLAPIRESQVQFMLSGLPKR